MYKKSNSPNKINNKEENINSIEKKLNSPNTTLEDLLEEEDIITEIRNQNQKLIDFFDENKIKNLVNYIIKEPKEDNELIGYKFPFIASEILNSDDDRILSYFINTKSELENINKYKTTNYENINLFTDDFEYKNNDKKVIKKVTYQIKVRDPNNIIEMLDYLLTFLETKNELNYVLAGYFSKFFLTILMRKPKKIINYLYQERKDIIKLIVYHCYRKSICDLLIKILNFDNIVPNFSSSLSVNLNGENTNLFENLNSEFLITARSEILSYIFSLLKLKENTEKISSIIIMLTELFENNIILNETMSNKKIFNSVFKELKIDLNSDNNINNSVIKNNYSEILSLLIYMISNYKSNYLPKIYLSVDDDMVEIGGKSNKKIIHTNLSENFFSSFDYFINNFKQNNQTLNKLKSIPTCYNNINLKPLGIFRVKIIELFSSFFPYSKHISFKYDEILISNNLFPIAFDYLFKYEWNNFYQIALLNLFKNYFKDANSHLTLSKYLFEKINIFEILKEHIIPKDTLSNKFTFTSNNTITHGYIPFIISLCYKINCVIGGIPIKLSIEESSKFISEQKFNEKTSDRYDDSINESQELILYQKNICESLRKYNNEEWNEFFKNYICETVKLYDNKLLFEDNENNVNLFMKNKRTYSWNESKNDFTFNNEIDFSDFNFTDEIKSLEKEEDIKYNMKTIELKVDELDEEENNNN